MSSASMKNNAERHVNFEADDLPMDVFSLTSEGLTVESLTAGHGLPDNGASTNSDTACCSCS